MSLFKKHEGRSAQERGAEDATAEHLEGQPPEGEHAAKKSPRKPKREVHAFNQVPPWEMNEELADRIAMRAYGDEDKDGKPDIPARPFPGF